MSILTETTTAYFNTFNSYTGQFSQWGTWLFFSLLSLNLVWSCLWYAFDRHSFSESMPAFIKQFFGVALFYTLMLHPEWLGSIQRTVMAMGKSLTHHAISPSSIIAAGIGLGNKIIHPVLNSGILSIGFGTIIIVIVYIITLGVFISIALDLAVTLITTTALISISTFFLGFAAINSTSQIARQTLDVILANCIKLLGIYLVVAAGEQTLASLANQIPKEPLNFDAYAWVVSGAFLFKLIATNLPSQIAKIISGAIHEHRGTEMAGIGLAAVQVTASKAGPLMGSMAYNIVGNSLAAAKNSGSPISSAGSAVAGPIMDLGKAIMGNTIDHIRHAGSKLVGGEGISNRVKSVPERLYSSAQDKMTISTASMSNSSLSSKEKQ